MKLLILAQTPPPLHGQSLMVETAVRGLPEHGVEVCHVNLRLSRTSADIGGWRPGKLLAVLDACFHAVVARFTENCDTLYYVPAPAKRGALYRDWLVMALCRPFFRRLVLHWHAVGLGAWLQNGAWAPERWLTRRLLGRASLSIVLADALRGDAAVLTPQRIAVVANGIPDPGSPRVRAKASRLRVLFLGAVTEEKGAAVLLEAVIALRQRGLDATAVFAGTVLQPPLRARLERAAREHPDAVQLAGFVHGRAKDDLLASCDCVCVPTFYRSEGQPLVALEALAADRPLVVTQWRALPETIPPTVPAVPPRNAQALAEAIAKVHAHPPPVGAHRAFFLTHYSVERHLDQLATALA